METLVWYEHQNIISRNFGNFPVLTPWQMRSRLPEWMMIIPNTLDSIVTLHSHQPGVVLNTDQMRRLLSNKPWEIRWKLAQTDKIDEIWWNMMNYDEMSLMMQSKAAQMPNWPIKRVVMWSQLLVGSPNASISDLICSGQEWKSGKREREEKLGHQRATWGGPFQRWLRHWGRLEIEIILWHFVFTLFSEKNQLFSIAGLSYPAWNVEF